jgi:hypothetical protein
MHELLDVLQARVVRSRKPNRIDRGVGHHVGDRGVGLRVANVEVARERRGGGRVLRVRTPDAAHVGVAHGRPSAQVKLGVESTADKPDAESRAHRVSALVMRS